MDNLQTSKFRIDLKTMIFVGSMLVSLVTMYFTFMGEMDARFGALENQDTELMNNIDKRLTELENKFTPIGDGVYSVDPNTTWPPSRGEYTMKQNMNANKILVLEETIERLEKTLEKLDLKLDNKVDK
jgi:tetrahydromethanopterin S-methyltransferase subunit G